MKKFTLPCLHFYLVFANVNSLEFYGKILVDYSFIKLYFLDFIHSCLVMPYSNWRRHNSPSIPHTPYQTLNIPCLNFDPIYQVILLENSNEWNLSPAKEWSSKKRREKKKGVRIEKKKRWNLIWKAPCLKKGGWDLQAVGRDSIEKEKKEITIFPI
jgi:hypothetical protein